MGISTHILDTTRGRPARGVSVRLERLGEAGPAEVARGVTNDDGRVKPLLDVIPAAGVYRLHFDVQAYFAALGVEAFYPTVSIDFVVKAAGEHYHVPLLLNPFGYATYRGS
ncbi:MAG: hydroxyisourate hydrolase [Myxococcaceae bacterium]|jgi:5-hydroxyisourate hydrolase|nr:hydroxyisourate hydrolase [Myxococcaceae bacterium]MCA3012289.1 hydroxyisourate hydrolase [Myxococcaceae bacterium]